MAEAPGGAIEVRRHLPASPAAVFRAWTDPERMTRWLSPVGHAEATVDLRVGGTFIVVMVGEDRRIEHRGEYLEVDPPRRLAFTWQSEHTGPGRTVVTVTFAPSGDGTDLTLVHEGLSAEAAASHRGGWAAMTKRLAGVLTAP
jgi:uncharacterized protein YndB with AHSA1/START domain